MFVVILELVIKNWRTTLAGVMGLLVHFFGQDVIDSIPQETWTMLAVLLEGVALAFARDSGIKVPKGDD